MGQKKMQMAEHSRVLTLLQKGNSVISVARDIGVSKETIFLIKKVGRGITTQDDIEKEVGLWHI